MMFFVCSFHFSLLMGGRRCGLTAIVSATSYGVNACSAVSGERKHEKHERSEEERQGLAGRIFPGRADAHHFRRRPGRRVGLQRHAAVQLTVAG